jgi:hypothetical protein
MVTITEILANSRGNKSTNISQASLTRGDEYVLLGEKRNTRNMELRTCTNRSPSTLRRLPMGLADGALSLLSVESSLERARESDSGSTPLVLALAWARLLRRMPLEVPLSKFERACNSTRSGGGGVALLAGERMGLMSFAGRFADRDTGRDTGVGAGCGPNVMTATIDYLMPTDVLVD